MEQRTQTAVQIIPLIHFLIVTGGSLRLLLVVAMMCAVLLAIFLVCTITALVTVAIGSLCLPVFRCSVAVV